MTFTSNVTVCMHVCIWKTVLIFILSTLCNTIIQCTGLKTREKNTTQDFPPLPQHSKQRSQIKARLRSHAQSADFLMTSVSSALRVMTFDLCTGLRDQVSSDGEMTAPKLLSTRLLCLWCNVYGLHKKTLPTCAENHSVYTFLLKSGHGYNTAFWKRNYTFHSYLWANHLVFEGEERIRRQNSILQKTKVIGEKGRKYVRWCS